MICGAFSFPQVYTGTTRKSFKIISRDGWIHLMRRIILFRGMNKSIPRDELFRLAGRRKRHSYEIKSIHLVPLHPLTRINRKI